MRANVNTDQRGREFAEIFLSQEEQLRDAMSGETSSQDELDDLLQDIALTAWRRMDSLPSANHSPTWFKTIATLHVLNRRRSQRRSLRVVHDERALSRCRAEAGERTHDAGIRVEELFRSLPKNDRLLLTWRYLDQHSSRQIAERVGRSQGSVCNSIRRVICRLRKRYAVSQNRAS